METTVKPDQQRLDDRRPTPRDTPANDAAAEERERREEQVAKYLRKHESK